METTAQFLSLAGFHPLTLVRTDTSYVVGHDGLPTLMEGAYAHAIRRATQSRLNSGPAFTATPPLYLDVRTTTE